jgi:hypothetical protein
MGKSGSDETGSNQDNRRNAGANSRRSQQAGAGFDPPENVGVEAAPNKLKSSQVPRRTARRYQSYQKFLRLVFMAA